MIRLLYGSNVFAISGARQEAIKAFLAGNDEYGLERLDAEDIDEARLRDALLQLPFLVAKKMVVIDRVFSNKYIADVLVELLDKVPDEVDVLLVDPKADKRTKLFKKLSANKQAVEHNTLAESQLVAWAVDYVQSLGSEITSADARYLVGRVGADQQLLASELEKMSYATVIDRSLIDELTDQTLQGTVFDLIDLVMHGKVAAAHRMVDQLMLSRVEPLEIMGLLAWQLHAVALVWSVGKKPADEVAKETGMHPFVVRKTLSITAKLDKDAVIRLLDKALKAEEMIKTGSSDPEATLRLLVLELSN